MKLPNQAHSIDRSVVRSASRGRGGAMPSQCGGVPNDVIGRCFFADDPPIDGFNCAACCALRTAIAWSDGVITVNC